MNNRHHSAYNPVRAAIDKCRPHFIAAAVFSAASNVLMLVPTVYMMQVYNRVLPTGGIATLAALSAVALFALAVLSALDWLRGRLLLRAGAQFEAELAGIVMAEVVARPELDSVERAETMRNFETLRQLIGSPGVVAILDLPWAPLYIAVAFLLHPAIGALTLGAGIALAALSWRNEQAIAGSLGAASSRISLIQARRHHIIANASDARALGIGSALVDRQLTDRIDVNKLQADAAFTSGRYAGFIKFLRLALQSGALGLGALLAAEGKISAASVFAASLILGRALAPMEQINAAWKSLVDGRSAYTKLSLLLSRDEKRVHTRLPAPTGHVNIERLTVLAPHSDRIALADINITLEPGQIIGLVGPSGAGKSSLLRALAGASPIARGTVRFDGASISDWEPEDLARHIGYLPQSFILFPGTVKENISRFRYHGGDAPEDIDEATIAAALAVGAHEMILRLPLGYDTPIGPGQAGFSGGQTQRIALARALYGNPSILLLDEPTAHLDNEATHAFVKTLSALRSGTTTVVFATHSGDLLASADKLLLLNNGRVERFGPLSDTMPTYRPVSHARSI